MRAAYTLALVAFVLSLPVTTRAAEPETTQTVATAASDTSIPASTATSEPSAQLGQPLSTQTLEAQRGGDDNVHNVIEVTGDVSNNTAYNVATGANTIREGSFENASGINTVVQNTGANVLIQNATILNVQFANPNPGP